MDIMQHVAKIHQVYLLNRYMKCGLRAVLSISWRSSQRVTQLFLVVGR